jgi:TonB family protein
MKNALLVVCFLFAIAATAQSVNHYSVNTPGPIPFIEEKMPEAGYDLKAYLKNKLHYPKIARINNIEGTVIIKFFVDEYGNISDYQVIRGIAGGCDKEAVRVIKNMPHWKRSKEIGKHLKAKYTLQIVFQLR